MNRLQLKKMNKKYFPRLFLAMVVLLFLAGMSVYTVFIRPGRSGEKYIYIEENVERGDLILGIMESGRIDLGESTLNYTLEWDEEEDDDGEAEEESGGYLEIEEVYVVKGQRIKEGDALFKLTAKSISAVKKRASALIAEAETALAETEAEYETGLLQAKSVYDISILEAEQARNSYGSSMTKSQESVNSLLAEQKALKAEMEYYTEKLADEELWEALDEAEKAYTAAKNKYENTDYHNAAAYTDNYSQYKSAKEDLKKIQEQIDEYTRTIETNQKSIEENRKKMETAEDVLAMEKLTSESAYESAVLGGELAEGIYHYTIRELEETVNIVRTEREEAEENRKELDAFVGDDGIIYADSAGLVTNVYYEEGDELTVPGAMISYVKEGACTVTVDVSEEDIAAISVGNKADVVIAAYPEQIYEGTITAVSTKKAEDYALTVSYPVTIQIEGDTSLLYGGMTADVTFVTDAVRNVIYVSKKAVQEVDGRNYVYKKGKEGKMELVEVETGFSDGVKVEIISGLSESDAVYIESKIHATEAELTEEKRDENKNSEEDGMEEPKISENNGGQPEDMNRGGAWNGGR